MRGPDQLVLRFPRAGGSVRAFGYPSLDSAVWTSSGKVPPIDTVLAFDENAGSVAAVDSKGFPVRLDLRLGVVSREGKGKLAKLASSDGYAIYGIASDGRVSRLTPAGNWMFKPPSPARDVFPQPDGSLLVLADREGRTTIWHLRPPQDEITDTAVVPRARHAISTDVGDRLYFTVDSGLIGVRSRDLEPVPSVRFKTRVTNVATTPSGNRLYVLADSGRTLTVFDRYREEVDTRLTLPAPGAELRMDETGRFLLVRPVRGDSVWVIAIGTDRIVGAVQSAWREDLPAVAPDGAIALVRGKDVVFVQGDSLKTRRRVAGGARDYWLFISWNGFRPRAAGIDDPVPFEGMSDSLADTADTLNPFIDQTPARDSEALASLPALGPVSPTASRDSEPASTAGFTAQFAALRSEQAAHDQARSLRLVGATPRVVQTPQAGVPIYRVIIGPYPTRAEAERIARTAGQSYWIYEGTP